MAQNAEYFANAVQELRALLDILVINTNILNHPDVTDEEIVESNRNIEETQQHINELHDQWINAGGTEQHWRDRYRQQRQAAIQANPFRPNFPPRRQGRFESVRPFRDNQSVDYSGDWVYNQLEHKDAIQPGYRKRFNSKTMLKYDYDQANASFDWEDLRNDSDNRANEIKEKFDYHDLKPNQRKMLDNLVDITINNKKDISFNRKLADFDNADEYARQRNGWAVSKDVTPYDDRDEPEVIIFNKYGVPTHVNGFYYTNHDAALQQMYEKTYPGGMDANRHMRIPYKQFKDEQFKFKERTTPWDRLMVIDGNPDIYEQLKGRGYKVPSAPKKVLSPNQIWNKVLNIALKKFIKSKIDAGQDVAVYKFINEYLPLMKLINILFIYYVDSHFIQMCRASGRVKDGEMETYDDYKKMRNRSRGTINKHQFRRMFFNIFIDPPNGFWWSDENSRRAFEDADINNGSIKQMIERFRAANAGMMANLQQYDQDIEAGKQQFSTAQQKETGRESAQKKAYFKKQIRDNLVAQLDELEAFVKVNVVEMRIGEWDQLSQDSQDNLGNLSDLDKPLSDQKWIVEKQDPEHPDDENAKIRYNIAEIPAKNEKY